MPVELTEGDRAFLRGERGEAAALAMRIVVEMAGVIRRRAADRRGLGACRRVPVPRDRGARVRRAPGRGRRPGRGAHHAERRRPRPAASRPVPRRPRDGRERPSTDGRVRRDGLPAHVDLRAVPAAGTSGVRAARRVGRIQRDRVLQLGARRSDRPVRGLHRHLRRVDGPRAVRRAASRRGTTGGSRGDARRDLGAAARLGRALSGARARRSAARPGARSPRSSACPRTRRRTG